MPVLSNNRQALHNYRIIENFEGGLVLKGWEVKSIRGRRMNLQQSFAKIINHELFLVNAYIPPFQKQQTIKDDPRRSRKILLKRKTLDYLLGQIRQKNLTIIPLKVYTKRNLLKIELALAKSKKKFEKKREEKQDDSRRRIDQEVKEALKNF